MADTTSKSGYIMVVEDDKLLLDAIQEKLTKEGLPHKSFLEGTEALKALMDQGERPSLIWLDFYLGDTNGHTVLKLIKENPETKDIPVIVVSNSTGGDKIQSLLEMGAVEYFVKSNYSLKEIIDKIKKIIKK